MNDECIDQTARDMAAKTAAAQGTHERECVLRYDAIKESFRAGSAKMKELGDGQKAIIRLLIWGGAATLSTLVAATGWLAAKLAEIALK